MYGDEILTEEQKEEFSPDKSSSGRSERKRRGLTRNAIRARWPNKEMHYTISNDYSKDISKICCKIEEVLDDA